MSMYYVHETHALLTKSLHVKLSTFKAFTFLVYFMISFTVVDIIVNVGFTGWRLIFLAGIIVNILYVFKHYDYHRLKKKLEIEKHF